MRYVLLIVSIVMSGCNSNKEKVYSCITPQGVFQASNTDKRVVEDGSTYLVVEDYDINVSIPKSLCVIEESK